MSIADIRFPRNTFSFEEQLLTVQDVNDCSISQDPMETMIQCEENDESFTEYVEAYICIKVKVHSHNSHKLK